MMIALCYICILALSLKGCSHRFKRLQFSPMPKTGFPAPTEFRKHEDMGELRPAEISEYEGMGELPRRQRTGGRWIGEKSEQEARGLRR